MLQQSTNIQQYMQYIMIGSPTTQHHQQQTLNIYV